MKFIYLLILIFLLACNTNIQASQYTWTGATDSIYTKSSNWSSSNGSSYPGSTDTATIVSTSHIPTLSGDATVGRLVMTSGTFNLVGHSYTVQGSAQFSGGVIQGGSLIVRGAKAIFTGSNLNALVDVFSDRIELSGGTFQMACIFQSTGLDDSPGQGGCIFNGTVSVTHNGTYRKSFQMGITVGDKFNGNLQITNNSNGRFSLAESDSTFFNGKLDLSNTGTSNIEFSRSGGKSVLAAGQLITIGNAGYAANYLTLYNFIQTGATAQTITLTGSAKLLMKGCRFDGNITLTAPEIVCSNCQFGGTAQIVKTGAGTNFWYGGNTFLGTCIINNQSTSGTSDELRLADSSPNFYYGDVTFESSGKQVQPVWNGGSEFKGNITKNSAYVTFKKGITRMNGTTTQHMNGTGVYDFGDLILDKPSDFVTIDISIEIDGLLSMIHGNLVTDSSSYITMKAGSTTSNASQSSFVSGPMKKIGNTIFEFPVGKSGKYLPLKISAPDSITNSYKVEYFSTSQPFGISSDSSIHLLSDCSYWKLERISGNANITVSLKFDSAYCGLVDSAKSAIVNWNGSQWNNLGRVITGNKFVGNISNTNAINSYSYFTIGYTQCFLQADAGHDSTICPEIELTLGGNPAARNGSLPISYQWNTLEALNDSSIANPVSSTNLNMTYYLNIIDSKGCSATDSVNIIVVKTPNLVTSGIAPSCFEWADGKALVSISGGKSPYTIFWLPDSAFVDTLVNLATGRYTVSVTDSLGCNSTSEVLLDQPKQLTNWLNINNVSCYGMSNGSIAAFPAGGMPPYHYLWSTSNDTTATLQNLSADSVVLIVSDVNGCQLLNSAVITQPDSNSIDLLAYSLITNTGKLAYDFIASQDSFPIYEFHKNGIKIQSGLKNKIRLNDVSNNDTILVLGKNYESDACPVSDFLILNIPPYDSTFLVSDSLNYCAGFASTFEITIDNPVPELDYLWFKNGNLIDSITGDAYSESNPPETKTVYTVIASDSSKYGVFTLSVQNISNERQIAPPSCYQESDAVLTISARGGSGVYSYSLDGGTYSTNHIWDNLGAGTHQVEIHDDQGCSTIQPVVIPEIGIGIQIEE